MSDLKWIKFDVWLFDRAEFKYLAKTEKGNEILLCWIKLLCEAAKLGDGGRIYVFKNRAIEPSELAILTDTDEDTVADAVAFFKTAGLITYDSKSGLVINSFDSYIGEGFGQYRRESESQTDSQRKASEKEKASPASSLSKSDEELKRERNREAQRRWRQRQREKKQSEAALKRINAEKAFAESAVQNNEKRNQSRNDSVTERNSESNRARNTDNDYCVKSSPKNIFTEENRIDKRRIQDKGTDGIGEENYNVSPLSHGVCYYGCGDEKSSVSDNGDGASASCSVLFEVNASSTRASDCDSPPLPLGNGAENCSAHPHTQKTTEKRDKKGYGIFNNVYLSDTELSDLNKRYGIEITKRLVGELSTKMESEGVSYKSHYATLVRWAEREASRGKSDNRSRGKDSCDYASANYGDNNYYAGGNGDNKRNIQDSNNYGERNFAESNNYGCVNTDFQNKDELRGNNERKKGLQGEPYKPKRRYGDFDAEEAFRLALERTEQEFRQ